MQSRHSETALAMCCREVSHALLYPQQKFHTTDIPLMTLHLDQHIALAPQSHIF